MANQLMPNVENFVDSTPLLDSPEDLRDRAADQGYLFFRSLLDAASVLDLRRQILAVCQKHGWLAPDTPLIEGVSRKDSFFIEGNSPEWIAFYTDIQRLRAFNALALHPAILAMFETLFGEKALPHSRNICRVIYPNATTHTTPPHHTAATGMSRSDPTEIADETQQPRAQTATRQGADSRPKLSM